MINYLFNFLICTHYSDENLSIQLYCCCRAPNGLYIQEITKNTNENMRTGRNSAFKMAWFSLVSNEPAAELCSLSLADHYTLMVNVLFLWTGRRWLAAVLDAEREWQLHNAVKLKWTLTRGQLPRVANCGSVKLSICHSSFSHRFLCFHSHVVPQPKREKMTYQR